MKRHFAAMLLAFVAVSVCAQQPFGACWHPDSIKNWSPRETIDKFNRAKVPLQTRFTVTTNMAANSYQKAEGQICDATILFPTCSTVPSQGANNFVGYQPTYWQYMDKVVYWAGSASEGIICCPPAGSIDAAHQSGVKILGNVFFPPTAYDGDASWVSTMLSTSGGTYTYAVKLYEIAKYFGFDGWFINEETVTADITKWAAFFKAFYAAASADGDTNMELQWYNASTTPNSTMLSTNARTSQFVEYNAIKDYRSNYSSYGCSTKNEVLGKVFCGIQCVEASLNGYGSSLRKAYPASSEHIASIDLFCPEEHTWKDNVSSIYQSETASQGSTAYSAITKTFANENSMWTNANGDPSNISSSASWPGISGCILERSVIQTVPFMTDFFVGVGKHRFVKGEQQTTQDWYHSGMQSILPTWRYWLTNKNSMTISIDWDDAYNVGSSLLLSGTLTSGSHIWRLYKTKFSAASGNIVRLVYKSNSSNVTMKLLLSTSESTTADQTLTASSTSTSNGWTVAEYDLSSLSGKTIYMIAFDVYASSQVSSYQLQLGQLAVLPSSSYSPSAPSISNLKNHTTLGDNSTDLRLTWDYTWQSDFDHFDIYTTQSGTRTLVGQTRDEGFYVPTFSRINNAATLEVELVPVMKDGEQKTATTLTLNFPAAKVPEVTISPSTSYVAVNGTVTLTATASGSPTSYLWTLPSNVSLSSGSLTDQTITVKATNVGRASITCSATNAVGTGTTTVTALDVLSSTSSVSNVMLSSNSTTVQSYSGSTTNELPKYIIDGVTGAKTTSTSQKWCCTTSGTNYVIFKCKTKYRFYKFVIDDANSGPESDMPEMDSYTIELSDDGSNWTTVVSESGVDDQDQKTAVICPASGQYVRFSPHVNGTLRIWEFEGYAVEAIDAEMTIAASPTTLSMSMGESQDITVTYDLQGEAVAADFGCTATASGNVEVGEMSVDRANYTVNIPITALKSSGTDAVVITLTNDGNSVSVTVPVMLTPSAAEQAALNARLAELLEAAEDMYTEEDVTAAKSGSTVGLITAASQFSSPYTETSEGSFENLLDGKNTTFWHSAWSGGSVAAGTHYWQVDLNSAVSGTLQLSMTRRSGASDDHITSLKIQGSTDGVTYTDLTTVSLPYTSSSETVTATFTVMDDCVSLRFYIMDTYCATAATSTRGYGHMSEFQLYQMTTAEQQALIDLDALVTEDESVTNSTDAINEALEAAIRNYAVPGDITNDGVMDQLDITALVQYLNTLTASGSYTVAGGHFNKIIADMNLDGTITLSDLITLIELLRSE